MRLALTVALLASLVFSGGTARATGCSAPPDTGFVVDPATAVSPVGEPRPADGRTARRVRAGVDNVVACLNSGDHVRAATLFTPHFVSTFMGQHAYRDVPAVLGGLRMDHLRLGRVEVYADGSFGTEAHYLAHGHRLAHERWFWWPDQDGFLKVNGLRPLPSPVPPHAAEITVELGEYFYRLDRDRVCAPRGDVVLRLRQVGREHHEAIVFRLPPGATAEDLFAGRIPAGGIRTVGQDNGAGEISLTRLAPGDYTLIDFTPGPDGRPHALLGQTARFTVAC